MTNEHLVLEFSSALSSFLLFKPSAGVLQVVIVKSHFRDELVSLSADLLKDTLGLINFEITISGYFFSGSDLLRTSH